MITRSPVLPRSREIVRRYSHAAGHRYAPSVGVFLLVWSACGAFLIPARAAISQSPTPALIATDPTLQQLAAARKELREAQQSLDALTETLKTDLERKDPEWTNLRITAKHATEDRDRLRERVLNAARSTPQYLEVQDSLEKARQTILRLTDVRDTASREFDLADQQAFAMRCKIREIEMVALSSSAELRGAEAMLKSATTAMNDHWEQYVSQVLANYAPWNEAVSRRERAQQAVKDTEISHWRAAARAGSPYSRTGRSSGTGHYGGTGRNSSHGSSNRSYR